jgi:very-short-patch-repair endonuclease
MSHLEDRLVSQIAACGLPTPEREGVLVPGRRFRCDLFWPAAKVICEVEGDVWRGGRHSRGAGMTSDAEKYNLLTILGWKVLRVTSGHIKSGEAVQWIASALNEPLGLGLRDVTE